MPEPTVAATGAGSPGEDVGRPAPGEPGRSYHSAYLASVPGYYVDTSVARFF